MKISNSLLKNFDANITQSMKCELLKTQNHDFHLSLS